MELKCECGNEYDFYEATRVNFIVNSKGEREKKIDEETHFFCGKCDEEVFMGDE